MKIEKIKKLKNGKYKLELDNDDSIITYDEVILKNNLLFNPKIEVDKLENLYKDTSYYDIYYKVVKLIAKKLRSEKEIVEYLDKNNVEEKSEIINKLKSINLINDLNFAKAYTYDRVYLSKDGLNKIREDLYNYGIKEEYIMEALDKVDNDILEEKLNKLVIKKINSNHNKSNYVLKQKIIYDLISLGYEKDDIISSIDNNVKEDFSLISKEYDKLYKKLSLKYDDNKLMHEIKNKLYQKGYSSYEIDKIINEKNS